MNRALVALLVPLLLGADVKTPTGISVTDSALRGPAKVQPASIAPVAADPALTVTQSPNAPATYSAIVTGLATAAAATDVLTIAGSASKKIKVRYVSVSASTTTTALQDFRLLKRSAANTGGTSSVVSSTPYDSGDAAATATVTSYTANPTTLGAAVGSGIRSNRLSVGAVGAGSAASSQAAIIWDFTASAPAVKPPTLNSASELVAVNFNGGTITGPAVDISITWTEE